jgi:peptidoglycan DL-endopeptidase LytE
MTERMRLVGTMSLFLILLALVVGLPAPCAADMVYTVRAGDSLYKIAKSFKIDVEKLKKANPNDSSRLKPGSKLTIPSVKIVEAVGDPAKESAKAVTEATPSAQKQPSRTRKGKKTETLARPGKGKPAVSKARTASKASSQTPKARTYTVKGGDNLWKIAKKAGVPADVLMEINDLDTAALKPGQELLLDAVYRPEQMKDESTVAIRNWTPESGENGTDAEEPESPGLKDRLITIAGKMLSIPYKIGGSSLRGFDCSGYVQKVFSFISVTLPRTARAQFTFGKKVDKEELSAGDLVFFRTYAPYASHVGIYIGENQFIHASSRAKKVRIDRLSEPYYQKRYLGARRFVSDGSDSDN